MTKSRIHQLLPTISPDDAIGNETLLIQKTLNDMGFESEIYAENIHHSFSGHAKNYLKYKDSKDQIIIYHHSIGSDLPEFLLSLDSKIILIYHNITPPEFFEETNAQIASLLKLGQHQLSVLKDKVSYAVGDSEFNRLDLEKLGYKKTGVLPILLDMQKYHQQSTNELISEYGNSTNILYVGRIAPNKRVDELIKIFSYYNENINPNSHLFLVGRSNGIADKYYQKLLSMIDSTNIKNVHFDADADDHKLIKYYQLANFFIIMSIHEGFCVPLVESMFFKVPIIAYNSTAIPYTLGEGGILVKDETYEEIAELVDLIQNTQQIKDDIITKQNTRFNQIYNKNNQQLINDIINKV